MTGPAELESSVVVINKESPVDVFVIVCAPVTASVEPSNVRLASASSSVVVEPIVTSSLAVALFNAVTAPESLAKLST